MLNWTHLNLTFKNYVETIKKLHNDSVFHKKPTGIYKELIHYLKTVIDSLSGLINRYFYLFEETPHLFLALELKDMKDIGLVRDGINQIKKPDFIDSTNIDLNTHDENNGEAALDFFYIGTKYAFFRISDDYEPKYDKNDESKLVHCFCNQLFCDWDNEIKFYINGLFLREVKNVTLEIQGKTYGFGNK